MEDIRDFGIAVSDAIRISDCYRELTDYLAARPSCDSDPQFWRSAAQASPGHEDWVHRMNSRNVAEYLMRSAILHRQFALWIRLLDSETAVDPYAVKELSHQSLAAGAYLELNDRRSFLTDRPLWIKAVDWRRWFNAAMSARYGEQSPNTKSAAVSLVDPDAAFAAMLNIWREEAIAEYDRLRNERQARLGAMGLTGGSDYVSALCEAAKWAAVEALSKAKPAPLAPQSQSIIARWSLSLFDELAALSNKHLSNGRLTGNSTQALADRFHAEGRAIVERELAKWNLELALSGTLAPSAIAEPDQRVPRKPAVVSVADAPLRGWWQRLGNRSEAMTQGELLAAARAAFPQKHVSRQRIRDLTGPRKTGPKPIRRKDAAK